MRSVLTTAVMLCCAIGSASADIVYDNGAAIENGHLITNLKEADDFQITTANTVNGASIPIQVLVGNNLGQANLAGWDGTLQWEIYSSVAETTQSNPNVTQPGVLLASGVGVDIATIFRYLTTSGTVTNEFYTFDFGFGQDIAIAADTTYWFALHLNQAYTNKFIYWQKSDTAHGASIVGQFNGTGNFGYQAGHVSFQLVPAPGAMSLLGIGTLRLARRKR